MRTHLRVGILGLLLASCSNDPSSTSLDTNNHGIRDFKVGPRDLSFALDTSNGERFVMVRHEGERITASIASADRTPRFSISVRLRQDYVSVCEATSTDRLCISQTVRRGEVTERFELNGRGLVVKYPEVDPITMRKSFELYRRGEHERIRPDLRRAFEDVEGFYRADNSLHQSPDGAALAEALLSRALAAEVQAVKRSKSFEPPELSRGRRGVTAFCAVVGIGTGLKCFFGGFGNPLCIAGTYTSIACGLFELACDLWWAC